LRVRFFKDFVYLDYYKLIIMWD